ncbi:MAG: methyltransferase type 11 [Acidobacteriaceae bacterium]|nr:methyltransferase type 11 [Acidobacteriaceae bacterium]
MEYHSNNNDNSNSASTASNGITCTATYSPEDNKLRLYASSRLDSETYARVKSAGFKWAPRQQLFVAPMWTPGREDLLLKLCGEIEDEDKSLVERAEERSERFADYSESRTEDADRAQKAVAAIAEHIPFGQPILIGHHSERRHRKDIKRIEDGMHRAVKMWDTAKYWTDRAAAAVRHAKHKERPDVRARRIKGLEADKRKQERYVQEAELWLKLWTECAHEQDKELQAIIALRIAGMCHLHLPRKEGDREDFQHTPTAYDALQNSYPNLYAPRTLDEIVTVALNTYPRAIVHHGRWLAHYENRIAYERAMLTEDGGTVADKTGPEKGGACRCWASPCEGWSYIQKVNKVSVTVLDNWNNGGSNFTRTIPFDKLTAVMSAAEVQAKRDAGLLLESSDGIGFYLRLTQREESWRKSE